MQQPLISVALAYETLLRACPDWGQVELPLAQALGRVLHVPILADRDAPPFPRVAMDGVALAVSSWEAGIRRYRVAGLQAAGDPPGRRAAPDSVLEVMTGAVLPEGCDCVIPVEELVRDGEWVELHPIQEPRLLQHVHAQGSDARAGAELLPTGCRLDSPALAVAAGAGAHTVSVRRRPNVALLSTGNELVPIPATPAPWQIRASNLCALEAALRAAGHAPQRARLVDDDPGRLGAAIALALDEQELLILSGGVSMGRFDHVPALLVEAGGRLLVHGVAQRPGKPLLVMDFPDRPGRLAVGLPGNPVSALICLHRYVLPLLDTAEGRERSVWRLPVPDEPTPPRGLTLFLPASLEADAFGGPQARLRPVAGSGDFIRLAGSAGFVEVDDAPAGTPRRFFPWR